MMTTDPTPKRPRGRPPAPAGVTRTGVAVVLPRAMIDRAADLYPGRSRAESTRLALAIGCNFIGAEAFREEVAALEEQVAELRERLASIARIASGGAL